MRSYERKEAVCLKKDLTQPTLLEMGLPHFREYYARC
jgi:hypothetical protein